MQGTGCTMKGAGYRTEGIRCRMLCRMHDAEHRMQGTGGRAQAEGCERQGAG